MANNEKLTELIDSLVDEKTFGLDAVARVNELRTKAADLEKRLGLAEEKQKVDSKQIQDYSGVISAQKKTIDEWAKRETDLIAREGKVTTLEKDTAVAQARSDVWQQAFDKVFRNTIVRETANKNVPIYEPYSGGGQTNYKSASEDKQRTTE